MFLKSRRDLAHRSQLTWKKAVPAQAADLKYRALLEISDAFIACRDYDALLQTLWVSLRGLIRFDYLALVRYNPHKNTSRLEAFAGDTSNLPLRTELPVQG